MHEDPNTNHVQAIQPAILQEDWILFCVLKGDCRLSSHTFQMLAMKMQTKKVDAVCLEHTGEICKVT